MTIFLRGVKPDEGEGLTDTVRDVAVGCPGQEERSDEFLYDPSEARPLGTGASCPVGFQAVSKQI